LSVQVQNETYKLQNETYKLQNETYNLSLKWLLINIINIIAHSCLLLRGTVRGIL